MNLQNLVQKHIDDLVASGAETGLQVAVYRHGELIVDAVAGSADPATGRPVTSDTPFFSASTGKAATATVANLLVDRGQLEYDAPIAALWPEFGAHGKEKATLRHVLTHSVGLPAIPAWTTVEDLTNWTTMTEALAAAEPWWEPGTKVAYHAQSFGFLVGELVRRATGQTISQVLRELVTEPLGIADELYLAVPASELPRVARLDQPAGIEEALVMITEMFAAVSPPAGIPSADYGNRADVLTAELPSGGTLTARGIAKLYAALLGEVDGVRLFSPERAAEIVAPALTARDEVMGHEETWGLGLPVGRLGSSAEESPTTFGMPGLGGSVGWADTATGVSFGLTKNRFDPTQAEAAVSIGGLVADAVQA
ncbi:serine hydrolase domain-containing protein [Kribbella sp. CA-294648]|uniref:serine hydrolase domain-containing protein n=1 Tax=Kribbella sp. CA-294648 TaxID=3239948 RepID=UPI003D8B7CFC